MNGPLVPNEQDLIERLDRQFSRAQLDAITLGLDAPSAIIAGAGSGKTTVMAARVVWLVGHLGIPPERILGLTFTNKAAAELGQRIRASLETLGVDHAEAGWGEVTASTYHAFAGSLIAEHGLRLGVEPDLRVVTDASRFQRFARAVESYEGTLDLVTTYVPRLVPDAMKLDSELSEHLVTPEALRDYDAQVIAAISDQKVIAASSATARKRTELSMLVDAYRLAKLADGVMDFSDQMAWGAQLAMLPEVRESMLEKYDVVLLDEYQDTSVAQRDLLVGLFKGLPVTAVGDPAQGIYGWRGAATGNLEDFLDDFAIDGVPGERLTLRQTYRCRPEIIGAANSIISAFYDDAKVTRSVEPLTSGKEAGGKVEVSLHSTVSQEISAMVREIEEIRDEGVVPLRSVAILVRVAAENGEIVKALRDSHIPFEIVGLQGLLAQPEVQDVVSLLEVVDDVTANPATLRLLTGPRWNIGPRDLALLGRRASQLSRSVGGAESESSLAADLAHAVEGTDPTEIVALADALEDLGDFNYSDAARERFGELASLISSVRRHSSEPLIDLTRRAVRALDLDIELEAGDVEGAGDNLALFLDAVATYAESDRYASLAGLLSYFNAEEVYNQGMEVFTPSEAESVKLLTVHRAKGLEWNTVFVPFMSATVFPTGQGRANWITYANAVPTALRGDRSSLPQMADAPEDWTDDSRGVHDGRIKELGQMEERRLAYVAYTRAEERLVLSGHWWGRTQIKPRGPSEFLLETRKWLIDAGHHATVWAEAPVDGATNPHLDTVRRAEWPAAPPVLARRHALAAAVREILDRPDQPAHDVPLIPVDRLDQLSADVDLLLAEADAVAAKERVVTLPGSVSTTSMLGLAEDEAKFARELARPMPRQPSPAARFGTRFHAWVEAHYGQQVLLDPAELPGQGDVDLNSDAELDEVIQMFSDGEYGQRNPHAIEAPFSIVLAGQQVIGRIDAVFATSLDDGRSGFEVVDWKTNKKATADPLQLSIYRLAWAELSGVDPADVTGAFYYVRLGQTVRYGADDLLDRPALEALLSGN
ncbi:DNA helicase-2/ATP-dependent DNA helicase PcrA [Aeromicrobium panaciterrae]|uniref:DNA 3'-5' helicase n=1 Tax=Aeromicrobium panaciterrae TaxID=363861 RepID=A0ABU1UMB0_9ACTN|nr:ATP-dependent DNA helicase [Aeromicrobium panaciterrae]MDR7086284.1 DNA helicase-2/ATP-dependent DNA helicase PcrA [Aeromicrobium panaciterrae]